MGCQASKVSTGSVAVADGVPISTSNSSNNNVACSSSGRIDAVSESSNQHDDGSDKSLIRVVDPARVPSIHSRRRWKLPESSRPLSVSEELDIQEKLVNDSATYTCDATLLMEYSSSSSSDEEEQCEAERKDQPSLQNEEAETDVNKPQKTYADPNTTIMTTNSAMQPRPNLTTSMTPSTSNIMAGMVRQDHSLLQQELSTVEKQSTISYRHLLSNQETIQEQLLNAIQAGDQDRAQELLRKQMEWANQAEARELSKQTPPPRQQHKKLKHPKGTLHRHSE